MKQTYSEEVMVSINQRWNDSLTYDCGTRNGCQWIFLKHISEVIQKDLLVFEYRDEGKNQGWFIDFSYEQLCSNIYKLFSPCILSPT